MNKHLIWVIGLTIITLIFCGTALWINAHSFLIRFEINDNTLKAIKIINKNNTNSEYVLTENGEYSSIGLDMDMPYSEENRKAMNKWLQEARKELENKTDEVGK